MANLIGNLDLNDASAGAIIATALFEPADYSSNDIQDSIVVCKLPASVSSPEFLASVGENAGFLFEHSTGHLLHCF